MKLNTMKRANRTVSVVGLGIWQLGADWGDVDEADARAVLDAAVEAGVTFFDTADVYGDGRSETIIGGYLADNPDLDVFVATKMGRRVEQDPANYSMTNFRAWADRSRRNLRMDTLGLVQLHCPPTAVYSLDRVFEQGVAAAQEFVSLAAGHGLKPATAALAWVAQRDGVSSVIPGARSAKQARANAEAGSVPKLGPEFTEQVTALNDRYFRETIPPGGERFASRHEGLDGLRVRDGA